MTSQSMTKYLAMLDCGHTVKFHPAPTLGDEVWCRRCGKYATVGNLTEEWTVRCTACIYGRSYGADQDEARRAAYRHASRRDHHVRLLKGWKVVSTLDPGNLPMPWYLDWLASNRQHAASLRSIGQPKPRPKV